MTPEEFDKRYRLSSKQSSSGVESWLGEDAETQRTVAIHRLVTGRAIGLLDMLAHLDPSQRSRVIAQFIIAGIPVVVTEPLPDSVSFVEWLENNVPSTVTAVIRPLRPKPAEATPRVSEEAVAIAPELPTLDGPVSEDSTHDPEPATTEATEDVGVASSPPNTHSSLIQGLTAIFAEQELEALRKVRRDVAAPRQPLDSLDAPPDAPQPARTPEATPAPRIKTTPAPHTERVTPVAQAEPGLTAIFEASEVRQRLDEARARATPTELPHLPEPQFEPPLLDAARPQPEIAESPAFRPRREDTPTVKPTKDESLQSGELEMPKYRLGFDDAPVPRDPTPQAEARTPTLDDSPLLEDSSFTQIVNPRLAKPTSYDPAAIPPPPPPQRKLSAIWVVIAIVALIVAITVVLLVLRLGPGSVPGPSR